MSVPRGRLVYPGRLASLETRQSAGGLPIGSPEAAAAIERVKALMAKDARKPGAFVIRISKP